MIKKISIEPSQNNSTHCFCNQILTVLSTTSFEDYYSHFWKDMKIAWQQVWTVWKIWQNGEIQPLNSSRSGMRSVWPSSTILQQNILLVPLNPCQLLFQRFECCKASPSTDHCPRFKEIHVDNSNYIPKHCCHKFSHQSLYFIVLYEGVCLRRGHSIDWHMASDL
jgi:hypothetical protein